MDVNMMDNASSSPYTHSHGYYSEGKDELRQLRLEQGERL